MRIRMKTTSAGPGGVYQAGNEYEVASVTGHPLVTQGFAEVVRGPAIETAEAAPARETTSRGNKKKRRQR